MLKVISDDLFGALGLAHGALLNNKAWELYSSSHERGVLLLKSDA